MLLKAAETGLLQHVHSEHINQHCSYVSHTTHSLIKLQPRYNAVLWCHCPTHAIAGSALYKNNTFRHLSSNANCSTNVTAAASHVYTEMSHVSDFEEPTDCVGASYSWGECASPSVTWYPRHIKESWSHPLLLTEGEKGRGSSVVAVVNYRVKTASQGWTDWVY